jgi:hypothetical protein
MQGLAMSEYNEGESDEYDPSQEGPEAKQFREMNADEQLIDRLWNSLRPEDSHRHLFTFEEMRTWNLKHKRFPKPPRKI